MNQVNLRPEKYEPEELDPLAALQGIHRPAFSSTEDEMAWVRECQLALNRQGVAWAVSPRCYIRSPKTAVVFTAGAELLLADFTIGQLLVLERRGCVLRATEAGKRVAACPADARWVVAPSQSITCSQGMLLAGAEVRPEWLDDGLGAIVDLVSRGVIVDRRIPLDAPLAEAAMLSLRTLEFERAKAAVDIAVAALAKKDDAKSEKGYLDSKLQLDLAGVRLEVAKQALEAAKEAEKAEKRAKLESDLAELEARIAAQGDEAGQYRAGIVKAARALADAMRAAHQNDDAAYQLRIEKRALLQSLLGREITFEHPPVGRLQKQLTELARIVDVDISEVK